MDDRLISTMANFLPCNFGVQADLIQENQTSWDVRNLFEQMMLQIIFWISPAAEYHLFSLDITQHSHVILLCHGACWLIFLVGITRTQWSTDL